MIYLASSPSCSPATNQESTSKQANVTRNPHTDSVRASLTGLKYPRSPALKLRFSHLLPPPTQANPFVSQFDQSFYTHAQFNTSQCLLSRSVTASPRTSSLAGSLPRPRMPTLPRAASLPSTPPAPVSIQTTPRPRTAVSRQHQCQSARRHQLLTKHTSRVQEQKGRPRLRPRRLHPHLPGQPRPRLHQQDCRAQGQGRRAGRCHCLQRRLGHVRLGQGQQD